MSYEEFLLFYIARIEKDSSLNEQQKTELVILFQSLLNELTNENPSLSNISDEIDLISFAQKAVRTTLKAEDEDITKAELKFFNDRLTAIGTKLITTGADNEETHHQKYLVYLAALKLNESAVKQGDGPCEELIKTAQHTFAAHRETEGKRKECENTVSPDDKKQKQMALIVAYKQELTAIENELAQIPSNLPSIGSANPKLIVSIRKQVRTERINFLSTRQEFLSEQISPKEVKKESAEKPNPGTKLRGRSRLAEQSVQLREQEVTI